jgi:[ribosomal protein S5]-alanine N-acetyltransferase
LSSFGMGVKLPSALVPLPHLTTERLWVRPLQAEDAGDLHELYADGEAMRYWHHARSTAPADTERAVRALVQVDAGQFAVGRSGETTVLGHVGFVNGLEAQGHAGFGYGFRRSAWGRGIAAEAARAALRWGFDVVGIARAELWIQRDNGRSVRLAERLGAVRRSEGPMGLIYGLTAEQFRGEGDPAPAHFAAEPILAVPDVVAALRWWVDVLGFRVGFVHGDPPTHAGMLADPGWTGRGRVQLTLRPPPECGGAMVYVPVSDVDASAERAVTAGATVVSPLGDRPWGVREIELADPSGNRIRLGAG